MRKKKNEMGFSIVKVSSFYHGFLLDHFRKHSYKQDVTYAKMRSDLMLANWGGADYFGKYLVDMGVDFKEFIHNAAPMQKQWAAENGINGHLSPTDIVFEQIKKEKPDVVYLQDSLGFPSDWIKELKNKVPSIKLIFGWCASPYGENDLNKFRSFDFMLTCSQTFLNDFKSKSIHSHLLLHGFDPEVLNQIDVKPFNERWDVIFAGSLMQGEGFHNQRTDIIVNLLNGGIDLKLLTLLPSYKKNTIKKILGSSVNSLNAIGFKNLIERNQTLSKAARWKNISMKKIFNKTLKNVAKPPVYGNDFFREIANAKINLNIHIDVAGDYAGNIRLFEVTGVGSCLLTDWKKNIVDIFLPDEEIVTFKSKEECLSKVRYLLNHPSEIKRISEAGKKRCLRDHSYEVRSKQFYEIIVNELKCR